MDRQRIQAQLEIDEGRSLVVYKDSLGFPTVGIGHLVLAKDGLFVGDTISEDRCDQLFNDDLNSALSECHDLYQCFDSFPEDAQQALVNMMFNMGYTKMAKVCSKLI